MFWFHNLAIAAFLESFEHRYLEYQWVMFLSVLNFHFWEKGSVAIQAFVTYSVRAFNLVQIRLIAVFYGYASCH